MQKQDTYKLLKIMLIESNFKREPKIDFNNKAKKSDVNIEIQNSREDDKIIVIETVTFKSYTSDKIDVQAKIKMVGIFEACDTPPVSIKQFVEINAPAIIFPFIREHLSTVSLKAGITPILLPPVNFVELAKIKNTTNAPTLLIETQNN